MPVQEQNSTLSKYLEIVSCYENDFKKWEGRVTKIIKKYRDDNRSNSSYETAKFNILWSNVQTLIPAVYSRLPKAEVSRRFGDSDPIGRVASLLLERSLDYEIEHYSDYRSSLYNSVEDRFLGGRGVSWVRYDPHLRIQPESYEPIQITEDVSVYEGYEDGREEYKEGQSGDIQDFTTPPMEMQEEIDYECSPVDYVHWKDFGHTPARTWEEVTEVWRWVYMTKEAVVERFGKKIARKIPFDSSPDPLNKYGQQNKTQDRAKICELWCKQSNKVYWFAKGMQDIIEECEDPLELEGFFPCSKPLYATTTTDNLIPVPDFTLYQDQANELDILSDRIDGLVKALRVRGVYDASQPALQRLLTEGENNSLIPVDKWMAFSEKGGLRGAIDLLPIDTLAAALLQCYQARSDIKNQVYEITGISDIIRGSTFASETATAQQIKGQYAGLRLRSMQEKVSMFATELLRIKAQIICSKYQDQTILMYSAADQLSQEDQMLIPDALALLRDNPLRGFRIDIAADSMVQIDEQQNKADRIEFMNAFANFMREAVPAGQAVPEITPTLMQLIKYAVSGFKQAKTVEGTIDTALEQLKQKAIQSQQNPQPDPAQIQMQMEQQKFQAETQAETQLKQLEFQLESEMKKLETQLDIQKMQQEAKLDAEKEIMVARIQANPGIDLPIVEQAKYAADAIGLEISKIQEAVAQMAEIQKQSEIKHDQIMNQLAGFMQVITAPKRIIRGPDGRAIGAEPIINKGAIQ